MGCDFGGDHRAEAMAGERRGFCELERGENVVVVEGEVVDVAELVEVGEVGEAGGFGGIDGVVLGEGVEEGCVGFDAVEAVEPHQGRAFAGLVDGGVAIAGESEARLSQAHCFRLLLWRLLARAGHGGSTSLRSFPPLRGSLRGVRGLRPLTTPTAAPGWRGTASLRSLRVGTSGPACGPRRFARS